MALDLILPLVELIAKPLITYVGTPIKRHVSYAFMCDSKVQGLQEKVEQLQNRKLRLQQSVNDAARNRDQIFPDVTKWLTTAQKDIGEAEELIQQKVGAKNQRCFSFCPNFKTRYQLSKNAEKKALAIDKLCNQEGFDSVSFQPQLQQIVEPSLYTREALPSRVSMLNQVMDALRDPNLNTIGVYGMGGVGKSTLAKEVRSQALHEKLFENVVLVAVSNAPGIRKIQQEIADFLRLNFTVEEISGRASQLAMGLAKSNVLIILDDLWHKLELSTIGIPSQGESKGCKIMLTSRNKDLLSNEMEAQKLFSLEALKDEETLCLFQMSVAEAKDPQYHHIANKIAEKCAGLPLLIQIVATDLRNKESYEWNNMLYQLSAMGDGEIYQKVHRFLESSYDNLPGEEMKQFFLLCALFGQSNIQIQPLLTHSMALGIFKHIHAIDAARDNILTVINKLKAKSLLLDGDMAGYVKMHDVVRDTALSIAKRVQHAFIGAGKVQLRDWPNKDCTRMSLPYCNVSELPVGLEYPEAEAFLIYTEDLSLEIPDPFFEGMKKLKVVDLLSNLQTLCLQRCKLECMAVLGEFRQLEFLSLANSNFVELPAEIEALTQLKLLDLHGCSDLRVIRVNLFSKLCSLEALYMLNSFERWNAKGNVSLVELENLAHLSTLEIQIPDPEMIPTGLKCFSQLKRYKISIGCLWDSDGESERSRMLKLKVEAGVRLEDDTEFLLRETEDLVLYGVRGIDSIFYEGFPNLKHMHVGDDDGIEHLIKSTMAASQCVFPVLESLHLAFLGSLKTICSGHLPMGSFKELRILKIILCNKLSSLFSFSSLNCLQQLRELEVISCRNMEAVVGERNEDEGIELTHLSSLKLSRLPHLTGFCKIKEGTEQMGQLFNTRVSFPNLTSLEVVECGSLKHIYTASTVKCLMQLKRLEIHGCRSVEEIIQSKKMEEIEEGDRREAIVFPKLDHLSLVDLHNVKWFSSCYSVKFPFLRELTIHDCRAMRNFVGRDSSSESSEDCLFNEMVTFSNLETMRIDGMDSIKYLWDEQHIANDSFSKLKSISITCCSKLSVIFPSEICTRFRRVESLSLYDCGGVEEIYPKMAVKEVNNPFSLRELWINKLQLLKHVWNQESEWKKGSFQNLQLVSVRDCENLKWVFPSSVGCGLPQLQHLTLKHCKQLEAMVAKAKDDEGAINASFEFPKLKELEFEDLKEMRSLYEAGPHTFECPNLEILKVLQCSNICLEKFIASVEQLIVDEQHLHAILGCADVSGGFCSKLKEVTLCSVNEETSTANIFSFLSKLKSLEMLVFKSCSLEETLGIGDAHHHCLRVKNLRLRKIKGLNYITKEDSQFNRILQTLHLDCCDDLISVTPSSTCLQNLTALHVYNCHKMKNLVTASTAKTMVHLVEMKVEFCYSMEEIVAKDSAEHELMITFNKLRRLELRFLPYVNSFCSDKYTFNFPLLEHVIISGCPRMKSFGCGAVCTPKLQGILFQGEHQWEGNLNATISAQLNTWVGECLEDGICFKNLESLEVVNSPVSSKAVLLPNQMQLLNKLGKIKVRDCDSIQVVFDLERLSAAEGYIGLLPKLEHLQLVNLPLVTQLCSKAPKGILDFYKLTWLNIDNCSSLKYVFTWSMASCLSQLRRLTLKNCRRMETLLVDEEDSAAKVTFSNMEYVVLKNMPKFSSIYLGSGDIKFPSLKEVVVTECPSIKALLNSTRVHSSNQVFPEMTVLSLDMKSVGGMMQFEGSTDLFSNLRMLKLRDWSAGTISHALLVRFLSRLLNLDQLELHDSSFQELLCSGPEETPTLPHVKSLTQRNLDNLCNIWWHDSLFQSLETLIVDGCNQLMNLITPSMAKCMVQLKLLRIEDCKMLMEVVGDGSDQATDEIVFPKLETLELIRLHSLKAFSLTHHNFNFPCLDRVVLRRCPNFRIFCNGIVKTEILNCVLHSGTSCWEGNLNTTTEHLYHQMVGFVYFEEIKLSALPMLKENWEAQFPTGFLSSLETLEVDNCKLFSKALPSSLVKHLECLQVLIVEKCDSVGQVIDFKGLNASECEIDPMRNLEELQLLDLPRLKQVWSKDHLQILGFKNLQTLKVDNCGSLTFIFNLSMALSLRNLQHVEVKNCSLVEHIILLSEEDTVQQCQTIFPSLQSLALLHLPNLVGFCSTSGVLDLPSLKMIEVADCPNVEMVASAFSEVQESSITLGIQDPDSISAFVGTKMIIPGLEELRVEWTPLKDQLFGNYRSGFLSKLKRIELTSFQGKEDANFLSNILRHFRSLENLCLTDSLIEEVTLNDLSDLKDDNNESALKRLKISNFPMLKHLVRDDCQPIPLFENLVDLEVIECSSLKVLVPSLVSFLNLTDLQVSKCDGLTTLLSASTARSLVQLKRMDVKDCKMMQEIVAIASDGEEYEIRFSRLDYLELDGLPCLESFSSGNYDFHFPSLEEVIIRGCPNMKNFTEKVSASPKLWKVKTGQHEYDWEWEGSLNNTIQALYMQKGVEETTGIRSES